MAICIRSSATTSRCRVRASLQRKWRRKFSCTASTPAARLPANTASAPTSRRLWRKCFQKPIWKRCSWCAAHLIRQTSAILERFFQPPVCAVKCPDRIGSTRQRKLGSLSACNETRTAKTNSERVRQFWRLSVRVRDRTFVGRRARDPVDAEGRRGAETAGPARRRTGLKGESVCDSLARHGGERRCTHVVYPGATPSTRGRFQAT